jgi:glycosyltransferase involved in cell wall biosynthesis
LFDMDGLNQKSASSGMVDPERYNPQNCRQDAVDGIREKCVVPRDWSLLLFVGRLTWVKSVRNLVQAITMVLKDYPRTKLVILGKSEEQKDII